MATLFMLKILIEFLGVSFFYFSGFITLVLARLSLIECYSQSAPIVLREKTLFEQLSILICVKAV